MAKFIAYTEPIIFYYIIIYGITKLVEVLTGSEKCFWESLWHKICDIGGESEAFYLIVLLTVYVYVIYWIIGLTFVALEKNFSKFKIQKKIGEIGEDGKFFHVS